MDIKGTTTDAVPSRVMLREKGSYHEDVKEIIEALAEVPADGKTKLIATFDTPKVAGVRAVTLRRIGYAARTRGCDVWVRHLTGDDDEGLMD